ncbi:MAG: 50S ribosomal protein L3 [Planctomycetaceae bacterium]
MPVGLLGRKVGMTQVYDDAGNLLPVTVIEAGPCTVLQVRTRERDGYEAVQIGFADKPRRLASRAERGHVTVLSGKRRKERESAGVELLPKADCEPKRFIREFRTDGEEHGLEVGRTLDVGVFENGARIDVIGKSKGRGFAGVMKRHNFSGQPASHGAKRVHRHGGSIGQSADPSRVMPGMRMAGQYGNERVTVRNLRVVKVDPENNLLLVRGAIPGPNGQYVVLRHTNKR